MTTRLSFRTNLPTASLVLVVACTAACGASGEDLPGDADLGRTDAQSPDEASNLPDGSSPRDARGPSTTDGESAHAPDASSDAGQASHDAEPPPVPPTHASDAGSDAAIPDAAAPTSGTAYYVDPLTGSMANPGSASRPWRTLEEVFAANKTFTAGDRVYLRRGYHGGPIIRGRHAGRVTIGAEPGHAPIMKWVKFSGAQGFTLEDVFINPQVAPADSQGTMIEFLASSSDNVVSNVGAYSTQDPYGWRANEAAWLSQQKQGLDIASGGNNRIVGVHLMNTGNGMLVRSTGNVIDGTTLENFSRDGWVVLGNHNTWQYNVMMNAIMTDHTISIFARSPERLHRDMVQTWNGSKTGMVFRGNTMIAVADPSLPIAGNDPTTTGYIDKRIPAFAGWDGPFSDYTFENNVIFTDHQAGIWLNNATNCRVVNNTMTTIALPASGGFPAVKIIGASSGNVVFNNIANKFDYLPSAVASQGQNLTAPSYGATFLAQLQPMGDVRLKPTASLAIDRANDSFAPALDADRAARPASARDIGAYERGSWPSADSSSPTIPGKPRVVTVPGLGADLAWDASTDNRAVKGYDVYRNGVKVGRTRNGARFFDVHASPERSSYAVVAFDMSGNRSPASPASAP